MIVGISYHDGDLELMRRWVAHVVKLGPYPNHGIVISPVHGATTEGIIEPLQEAFAKAHVEACYHTQSGWPISCNLAFEQIARYVADKVRKPFLWMEPDAIPLCSGWLDKIESEYVASGKEFMGDFVGIKNIMPNGVDHMSGVAVYHWDLYRLAPSLFNNELIAWDIASAKNVVPRMAKTKLIQHDWVPTKKWRRDVVDKSCVKPDAVIYHPDKLGVLMDDGFAIPNGTQGDPAAGTVLVDQSPHETKELHPGQPEFVLQAIENQINALSFHCKSSPKLKKIILSALYEKNLIAKAPKKAKPVKRPRKQVSSSVEEYNGPRAY